MIPLIRKARPDETSMVLSDWKKDLHDRKPTWGRALFGPEWWSLVNYVLDVLTYPTCEVFVVCHPEEPDVPLAWAATRAGGFLHMHAKGAVQSDPEIAARLEMALTEATRCSGPPHWNPFTEFPKAKRHTSGG